MFCRIVPLAFAAAVFLPTSGPAQEVRGREGSSFTWSERVAPGQWLRVYGVSGRIEVTAASGDVAEVVAEKDVRGGRTEDIAFEILRGSNGVTICAIYGEDTECNEDGVRHRSRRGWNDDWRGRSVRFSVRVPRGVLVAAQSGNGAVAVSGATAEVRAASGNGRVRVSTSGGPVNASSGNGDVTVEQATGPVRASSGNGRVIIATTRGPVNASTGNGDIEVTMDAMSDVAEDMEFSSGNGTITVTVPADFSGELDASTGSGRFHSDFPLTLQGRIDPRHVRATIGRGGRRLRMSSGNGDVELRKKG